MEASIAGRGGREQELCLMRAQADASIRVIKSSSLSSFEDNLLGLAETLAGAKIS
jgi:hypothetical protein